MLDERQRSEDPMLASCIHMAMRESRFGEQGKEIDSFIAPLFERGSPTTQRQRLAARLMFDVTWRVQPDYRAEKSLGRPRPATVARKRAVKGTRMEERKELVGWGGTEKK